MKQRKDKKGNRWTSVGEEAETDKVMQFCHCLGEKNELKETVVLNADDSYSGLFEETDS